jgi:hypothetical protein
MRWFSGAVLLILASSAGCSPWPPTQAYGGDGATPGAAGGTAAEDAVGAPPLVLPADGASNGDGTVTAIVHDERGDVIGHVDFFTSDGAPQVDSAGNVFYPDAFIGVSGLENPFDLGSAEVSGEIDIPADSMTPGASFVGQAGGLEFVATVERADVRNIDGADAFEGSSLVVRIDVSSDVPNSSATDGSSQTCTPDAQETCSCPDGAQSIAQCQSDGQWGGCSCSGW